MTTIVHEKGSHSGRELDLMLIGKKPMAVFCKFSNENFDQFDGQDFRKHVLNGSILKRRFYLKYNSNSLIYTCFCLPSEEWRFYCYKSIVKLGGSNWSDEKEAVLSLLLGYSLSETISYISCRN